MKEKKFVVMKKRSYKFELTVLSILIVLAAAIVGFRLVKGSDGVAATVDGDEITEKQVELLHLQLSKKYENVTKADALYQAIDETLLLHEAKRLGIIVTDAEVEKIMSEYRNATSEKDLRLYWESQGISQQDAPAVLRKQETINRLLNQTILSKIEVSDEEVESYSQAFRQQVSGENIVFEPSPEQIRQAIHLDRAKNSLTLYLNQLRAQADIEIKK